MQCMLLVKLLLKQRQVRNLEELSRQKLEFPQESYISQEILFIINKMIQITGKVRDSDGVYTRVHTCCLQHDSDIEINEIEQVDNVLRIDENNEQQMKI